jgi:ABC-type transport system substrate-binding protein
MEGMRPLLGLAATLAIVGCGSSGAPSRHEIIDSRDNYDPRSLDPALSTDVPTGRAVGYVFDGLTRFDPNAKVEPGLAERWDISPDGLTYTFHLPPRRHLSRRLAFLGAQRPGELATRARPGNKKRRRVVPLSNQGRARVQLGKAKSVSGITVRDDSTLVVVLAEPLAIFVKMIAMPVAAIVPSIEKLPANFGEHPIGTGTMEAR